MAPGRRCPSPSRSIAMSCTICLAMCGLDVLLLLPHPATQPRGALGMPGHAVRANYSERIVALSDFFKLATDGSEAEGVGSRACRYAALVVEGRDKARLDSRLLGSAAMHALLRLHDLVTYRTLRPLTLSELSQRMRSASRINSGRSPTSDEVCLAVAESALKTDDRSTASTAASAEADLSYEKETCIIYAGSCMAVLICLFLNSIIQNVTDRVAPMQLSHRAYQEEPEAEGEAEADVKWQMFLPQVYGMQQENPNGNQEEHDKKRL